MSISAETILAKLKRVAKKLRQANASLTQAKALDQVAAMLGFNNWSLVSKHVNSLAGYRLSLFHEGLYERKNLDGLLPPQFPDFDEDEAAEVMRTWVEGNFTRLIEFAYYDNESENGFGWPDEDISNALQEEFDGVYPLELIEKVAVDIEMDGPWGIEDYGDDSDEPIFASPEA